MEKHASAWVSQCGASGIEISLWAEVQKRKRIPSPGADMKISVFFVSLWLEESALHGLVMLSG
jgi:hypothetical protein